MTLKIASALIACMLAAGSACAQTEVPTLPVPGEQSPEDGQENQAPPPPPQFAVMPLPVYTPAWTERWWVSGSYIMGLVQPVHLQPLVTTSPAGTQQSQAGVLGPTSTVLFGGEGVNGDLRSGFRFETGVWFNDDRTLGCQAGFFWLGGVDQPFSASSNGSTILARPFIDAASGSGASLLVAFPNGSGPAGAMSSGTINVSASSGQFYGGNFDFTESIINDPGFRLKSMLGYRYIHFSDGLQISETLNPTGGAPAPPPGTQIFSQDSFGALNTFNGVDIGMQAEIIRGPFAATFLGKVAIGYLQREVNISGNTSITAPGNPAVNTSGGLLALSTNSGSFDSNVFTVVPEAGLTLSWNVTNNIRLSAGYSVFVLYHAVRAADQVDLTVNSSLLNSNLVTAATPSSAQRPAFALEQSNIWVQTINFGFEFRY